MRRIDGPNECSYQTVCASKNIQALEVEIMDALKHALEDCNREDVPHVDGDFEIEDKESKFDFKRADTTEYPNQHFVIRSEVQK